MFYIINFQKEIKINDRLYTYRSYARMTKTVKTSHEIIYDYYFDSSTYVFFLKYD